MLLNILRWHSLKTRVTLFTLAIFLVSIWTLTFFASRMLHADMERVLGEQQFATVSVMAEDVNQELEQRLRALENVAGRVGPAMLGNTATLQMFLEEQVVLQSLFNGGIASTAIDGAVIADVPLSAGRIGVNYMDVDVASATALREGKSTIGRPLMGKKLLAPVFVMVVPIRDPQGKVIGTLTGVINLGKPNFLDQITANRYGKTGGYLLMAPQHNLIVTATDKSRIMQPLPAPGINPLHDRYMQGFNGFGTAVSSRGIEELSAAQRVPVAGWFAVAVLPTAEAFAPIHDLRQQMFLYAIFLTLLAGILTWWMLRRELLPLITTARTLAAMAQEKRPPQPLPLTRQDETDQLIGGFNRLLQTLAQREETVHESEERYRTLVEWTPEPIGVHRGGKLLYVNPAAIAMFGEKSAQNLIGKPVLELVHPDFHQTVLARIRKQIQEGVNQPMIEEKFLRLDGTPIDVEVQATSIIYDGEPAIQVAIRDITARKQIEVALRESEMRFRSLTEMSSDFYWESDAEHRLTQRGAAGKWSAVALFGRPTQIGERRWEIPCLSPDEAGWQAHRAVLQAHRPFRDFEFSRLGTDGTARHLSINGDPVFDASGAFKGYRGVGTDITARKQAEQALHKSEHGYRIMFDSAPEGVWMIGPDRRTTQVNQKMCDLLGYAREDLLGRNPVELADEENGKIFEEKARIVPNRQTRIYEVEMRHRDGHNIPCEFSATNLFNEDGSVMGVLAFVTDLTERKKAESQIQNLAFSDPLTGLANRRLLLDRLKQALATGARHQRQGALLFIDLDDFRTVNDALGHDRGDLLLQQVAQRLLTCVREGDTVARLGGDEFVVLLEDLRENTQEAATQAGTVAEKILVTLNTSYQLGSHARHSTASVGITLFGAVEQEHVEEPMKRAELAMYQAQATGRGTLCFFEAQMQAAVSTRATLEAGLREAVLKNQFLLHYQAQVNDEGKISGVEALVRWQDPKRGLVPPAEFIPLAEETGLILPLGQWVLEAACKQLALWAKQPALAHLTMAVNVSARQFHHQDFVDQVLAVLDLTGANPQRLKLELTESLLVSKVEDVIARMSALKEKGVGFSLDDFGTGYSSLSYLKQLPLDQLKIDISFVKDILTDPSAAAIAKTVIDLAQNLGLAVIAEGVEIEGQRDLLDRQGCHAYQGYLFSRPLPLAEFEALAKKAIFLAADA